MSPSGAIWLIDHVDHVCGLAGPEDYPRLVEAPVRRGHVGDRLERVLSGNWLRFLGEALP